MKIIRDIVISTSEPPVHNVAWLQPQSNNTYKLFIYGNNGWTPLSSSEGGSGGGTTADIPLATQSKAGLMSAEDKTKLDNLVVLTQEEYNALEVKAENTIYFIKS